jgi:hypothetical protein
MIQPKLRRCHTLPSSVIIKHNLGERLKGLAGWLSNKSGKEYHPEQAAQTAGLRERGRDGEKDFLVNPMDIVW